MKYLGTLVLGLVLLSSTPAYALGVGANGTITIDANVSGSATTSTGTSGSTGAQGNAGSAISVSRADADAASSAALTITSPIAVKTQADLSTYASGVIKADADTGDAQLSSSAVSLGYTQRARLFGFIPVLVQATATVDANGDVNIRYPWYAVFATTDSASLQSEVKDATSATVSANGKAGAQFSAGTQARLLAEIHDAMQAHLRTSLQAEAQANASSTQ